MDESFVVYLLFQLILLMLNSMGFNRLPILSYFALIGTMVIAVPTVIAFGDYYLMSVVLILINASLPIFAIRRNSRRR